MEEFMYPSISSPYYLHPSDNENLILIPRSIILTGFENYHDWAKAMRISLLSKNKWGFIDGSLTKPNPNTLEADAWKRCDSLIYSWLVNTIDCKLRPNLSQASLIKALFESKSLWDELEERYSVSEAARIYHLKSKLSSFKQRGTSVGVYYIRMKVIWDELDHYYYKGSVCYYCGALKKIAKEREDEKIYQFLLGLDDSVFGRIRARILDMDPLPSLEQVDSMVTEIECNHNSRKLQVHFDGKAIVTTFTNKAYMINQWVYDITNSLHWASRKNVVGLNIEWRPNQVKSVVNPPATLQLCVDTKCLIIQLFYLDYIPQSLKDFLSDPRFSFVGLGVADYALKLQSEYGLECGTVEDVREAAVQRWPYRFRGAGLKELAREVLGLEMEKSKVVTLSDWQAMVLSDKQIEYACIDAYVSYRLGLYLLVE